MSAGHPLVRVEEAEGVSTVVLDDPARRNALSWDLVSQLVAAVEGALESGARALVLTNTAPVFSAGGSVDDLLEPKVPVEETYRAFRVLDEARVPTVAAVDGAAVGAGINLALACDVVLCTPGSRFDVRFLDVGIHPGGGALWRLRGALGRQGAAALTLFGEVLDGAEAARRGLVWRCVPPGDLVAEAQRLARRAATRDPELVAVTKRTLDAAAGLDGAGAAIDLEAEPQKWSMDRPAFQESLVALRARLGRPG